MFQANNDEAKSMATAATGPESFPSTHWSVVLAAEQGSSPAAQAALEKLCRAYWYPLYVYVRRRGYSPEDAQDLTQSFFERLLERDLLAELRPAGARFRSFLLHAMKNLLASEWTRAHAAKRGGASAIVSLEEVDPEAHYAQEAADTDSPDAAFERRWAGAVLQQALERLRQEQVAAGKEALFDCLADSLTGAAPSQPHAQLAGKLGLSEAAVKMTIHRLRQRYGELLRLEVAQTVVTPAEIDEEPRHLLRALART
ncbi:MAG TPA: sigma-70 family RNA polymerase sigma factor [Dongiaceae bacterium]|nr:sigma-70 family RNA polymerase sigma factor [Dongiaceae bacterium]